MPLGPVNISVIERSNNVHMDTRILLRRAVTELEYGQMQAAAATLKQLMSMYEEECPTDAELYELDQLLVTAKRAINRLFGPPNGAGPASKKKVA